MLYRQELVNLEKDIEDARILMEVAGLSFIGPSGVYRVRVNDSTEEGRKMLENLLERGYKIESIDPD